MLLFAKHVITATRMHSTLRRRIIQIRVACSLNTNFFIFRHSKVLSFAVQFSSTMESEYLLLILWFIFIIFYLMNCVSNFIFLYCIFHWRLPHCSSSLWALIIIDCLPHYLFTGKGIFKCHQSIGKFSTLQILKLEINMKLFCD